jgi:hypothetical protein
MDRPDSTRMIIAGVALAFALLIGAVWASDVSLATSLALTGGIVLAGVATIAMVIPTAHTRDRTDDQRDRMKQTTP